MELSRKLAQNLEWLGEKLGVGVSFDVVIRQLTIAHKEAAIVFIDGFVKDQSTTAILHFLQEAKREELVPGLLDKLMRRHIPYYEIATASTVDDVIDQVLSGPLALLIDGESEAVIIDTREYPVRSIEEPDLERVTRGSRDGFVETIVFNTALIRRRVRDPGLRFEVLQVGNRSKTDVAIGYVNDLVDQRRLSKVRENIKRIKAEALLMGAKSLEEYLWYRRFNPLPLVRYTERPDVVAAHLLEGHIMILTDTTPMAMLVPVTVFHFTQHAEEFFHTPLVGTYLRWVRTLGTFLSLFLTPLWLALYLQKSTLPSFLQFIGPKESSIVPVAMQLLILEVGFDLIRMALIHTPSALATSLGIVGGILLGDLAVQVGLFVPETILYTAVVAISHFAIPSIEFGLAIRMYRYLLLIAAAVFKVPGLLAATLLTFVAFATTRSLGVPYLWPAIPLSLPSLLRLVFRYPIPQISKRPDYGGKDQDTQP